MKRSIKLMQAQFLIGDKLAYAERLGVSKKVTVSGVFRVLSGREEKEVKAAFRRAEMAIRR